MTEPLIGRSGVRIWPNGKPEEQPTNALGQPSPNRTDFTRWARANLETFARQAADENLLLRHEVAQLKLDLATALAAWRKHTVAQG